MSNNGLCVGNDEWRKKATKKKHLGSDFMEQRIKYWDMILVKLEGLTKKAWCVWWFVVNKELVDISIRLLFDRKTMTGYCDE